MPPEDPKPPDLPRFGFDGFSLERIVFEGVQQGTLSDGEQRPKGIQENIVISGGIQINQDAGRGFVTLSVVVEPDPKWKPYRLEVVILGSFTRVAGSPEQFDEFCRMGAPSILFPYIREIVHRTTMDNRHGVTRLHPISLQALLQWKDNETPKEAATEPSAPSPP